MLLSLSLFNVMDRQTKLVLLKVSVLSIRADGKISGIEASKFKDTIDKLELTEEEYVDIDKCWVGEFGIAQLTSEIIALGLEREAFQRAVLILISEGLNQREHEFLREFGDSLNLNDDECSDLFDEVSSSYDADFVLESDSDEKAPVEQDLDGIILKYSTWAGSIGLTPIPVISDFLILTPLQMKMVHDIGKSYGYELDKKSMQEFSALLGVAFGLKIVGSIMKIIPIIGSLGSAALAFSGTYAMGKTAETYFKRGREMDKDEMRKMYNSFVKEGKKLYKIAEEKVKNVNFDEIKRKFTK